MHKKGPGSGGGGIVLSKLAYCSKLAPWNKHRPKFFFDHMPMIHRPRATRPPRTHVFPPKPIDARSTVPAVPEGVCGSTRTRGRLNAFVNVSSSSKMIMMQGPTPNLLGNFLATFVNTDLVVVLRLREMTRDAWVGVTCVPRGQGKEMAGK